MALYLGSNEVSQKVLLLGGNKSDIEVGDLCYSLRTEKEGWLLCNGASYSTTDYPDLFAVIGYTFGGSENNFNVPNYKGKFLQMINDSQTIGQNIEAGLPNITGSFQVKAGASASNWTGAFYAGDSITSDQYGGSFGRTYVTEFSAEKSSDIYGASSHVTPVNQAVNYFIKAKEED